VPGGRANAVSNFAAFTYNPALIGRRVPLQSTGHRGGIIKALIKELLPPLLVSALRRRLLDATAFASYEQARTASESDAYEAADLVQVIVAKNVAYRQSLAQASVLELSALRTLAAIGMAGTPASRPLSVLDFGGGGGTHYTIARKALGPERALAWAVVETPAMVRAAGPMCDGSLAFFDDVDAARAYLGTIDLVFTSGALHCCPDPLAFLARLVGLGAPYLVVTRTAFHDGPGTLFSVQKSRLSTNGPGPLPPAVADRTVSYPNVVVPRAEVERLLRTRYAIRARLDEEADAFRIGSERIGLGGYLCAVGG
jgi:putative methyltransferase (TIGR04325 family)